MAESSPQELDLGKPTIFVAAGKPVELYTVGVLAWALNRQSVTIRKWETDGVIPVSPYTTKSHDPRGVRRLYTKEHILGLRQAAFEEGVLYPTVRGKWKHIEDTKFKEKALKVFSQR